MIKKMLFIFIGFKKPSVSAIFGSGEKGRGTKTKRKMRKRKLLK